MAISKEYDVARRQLHDVALQVMKYTSLCCDVCEGLGDAGTQVLLDLLPALTTASDALAQCIADNPSDDKALQDFIAANPIKLGYQNMQDAIANKAQPKLG